MPKALLGDQLPSSSGILSGALGKTVSGKKSAGRLAQLRVVRNLFVSAASSWMIWSTTSIHGLSTPEGRSYRCKSVMFCTVLFAGSLGHRAGALAAPCGSAFRTRVPRPANFSGEDKSSLRRHCAHRGTDWPMCRHCD
jgi:hypothetical protein